LALVAAINISPSMGPSADGTVDHQLGDVVATVDAIAAGLGARSTDARAVGGGMVFIRSATSPRFRARRIEGMHGVASGNAA